MTLKSIYTILVSLLSAVLLSCTSLPQGGLATSNFYKLHNQFPSEANKSTFFDASIIASPLIDLSQGIPLVIVPVSDGTIVALNAETGAMEWQLKVPVSYGQKVELIATPVVVGDKLVVVYQCIKKGIRNSHRMVVVDLKNKQLDSNFPLLELTANKTEIATGKLVSFDTTTAFSHAELKHVMKAGTRLGYVYAAFGAAQDTQPFHGWLFEIDLDAWQASKANPSKNAIASVFLTTPEAQCPLKITDGGTQEMICGGGIWAPSGIQIYPTTNDYELIVPTGNGQIDLARQDYANALLRLTPGLQFNPECDANLCKNFNPVNPSEACMASCKNLFIPRLTLENKPIKPASGSCDSKSYWECLAFMDYDLGASTPVKVELGGYSLLVQTGKDGGVFLIDGKHLGKQYDRLQIVDNCGTKTDPCRVVWAGMIVTKPVVATIDDEPVIVIPTFVTDRTHAAGLVALKIVLENGTPKFKRFWQFPRKDSPDAVTAFRSHPSMPALTTGIEPIVWLVDIGSHGTLYGVRVKDGVMVAKKTLQGTGRQLITPLIYNNKIYVVSNLPQLQKTTIEAFAIEPAP